LRASLQHDHDHMMIVVEYTTHSSYKTWQTNKAKLMADFFCPGESQHLIMQNYLPALLQLPPIVPLQPISIKHGDNKCITEGSCSILHSWEDRLYSTVSKQDYSQCRQLCWQADRSLPAHALALSWPTCQQLPQHLGPHLPAH